MGYAEDQWYRHNYGMTKEEFHQLFLAREADIKAGREKDKEDYEQQRRAHFDSLAQAAAYKTIPTVNFEAAMALLEEWARQPSWMDGVETAQAIIALLRGEVS